MVGVPVVGGMLGISIESRVGDMLGSGVGVYVGPSQPEKGSKAVFFNLINLTRENP